MSKLWVSFFGGKGYEGGRGKLDRYEVREYVCIDVVFEFICEK